jgi:CRP/FNR family cyclic AMP-dependent transcriptional regulator
MTTEVQPPCRNASLERLLRHCHRRRYPGKTPIIKPGDKGDTLYYVAEGSVKVSLHDKAQDQDIVLAYLNKGDFIGEIGVFMGPMPRDVTVTTREPSHLAEIGYARLHQLLVGELADCAIDLLFLIGRQLSHRLLATSRKVEKLVFSDVTQRIVYILEDLCRQPDAMTHPDGMQIRVTRQEIGRLVGCSREMAGKVLKKLAADGRISASGKTIVVFGAR